MHPSSTSSCVKIYLCSNPEDSVIERRVLREKLFPRFRDHCQKSLGLDFRVIDPFESRDPSCWPDENSRQQLIEECRRSSAGPFLLALVGHQYGGASLPSNVEVTEYQLLLQASQEAGVSTQALEKVYHRDENTIPPSYCLRPHTFPNEEQQGEKSNEKEKGKELQKVFQEAASLSVLRGLMTPERACVFHRSGPRYLSPVLDADLRFALENCPAEDIGDRCVVYVHKVLVEKKDGESKQTETGLSPDSLLSELCSRFLPGLVTFSRLLVYTTTTVCDCRHGYTETRRRSYADALCLQVFPDLVMLTNSWNIWEPRGHISDALSREWAEQEQLCHSFSGFYQIIRPEENEIRDYLEQREQQRPLVVTGESCTGKTTLVAHCPLQIKSWAGDGQPFVIYYFCNLLMNSSPKHLLFSLCSQIASKYKVRASGKHNPNFFSSNLDNCSFSECTSTSTLSSNLDPHHSDHSSELPSDISLSELEKDLSSLLTLPSLSKRPLVLIFDGLDQIESKSSEQIIKILPVVLPPGVKLILTFPSNQIKLFQAIRQRYSAGSLSHNVEAGEQESGIVCVTLGSLERKQCLEMLASLLRDSRRRVTSGQQLLVNRSLASCTLPLYVRLLHAHTSTWHSDSDVTERSLPEDIHSAIAALLEHLELKHGSFIVSRTVSYLSLSRAGLSEGELSDLLVGKNRQIKVSQVEVEMMLLDLKNFLMRRTAACAQVLFWVSGHFKLVAVERYLRDQEVRRKIHSSMADYFSSQGFGDVGGELPTNSYSGINMRIVFELPHHLKQSGRLDELDRLFTSFEFHQAMVKVGLLDDLVAMLDTGEHFCTFQLLKERLLLANTLRSSACFLRRSPLQLQAVMERSLYPYVEVFPALQCYVRDIRRVRKKSGGGLGLALCPSPSSVPAILCIKNEDDGCEVSVAETSCTENGVVAEVMNDGSVRLWRDTGCKFVRMSQNCKQRDLKFIGVKSSGQFLLLSTQCNKLFIWDGTGSEILLQIKNPIKAGFESNQISNRIGGFVVCHNRLAMWWRNESLVGVYDISNHTMADLRCVNHVTSLVFSWDHFSIYCGQKDGIVSVFDIENGDSLCTFSNSTHNAVLQMISIEIKREVGCVDCAGNVTVWNVSDKLQPRKLVKESLNLHQTENVINTDYSDDVNIFLVCQAHQVTLWDTSTWEMCNQFLAKKKKAFKQALLIKEGHLLIALLDATSLIFVWKVNTGECVLSLDAKNVLLTLFKTVSDIICVSTNGCLTVWDSSMIDAAGMALKMGCEVKEVVIDLTGKWFYTTNQSEEVWKWSSQSGYPDAYFFHDGPVEQLKLSPNGVYLVSLSAGEIYVWLSETGENVVRIGGSGTSDLIITPNSNLGVSISERGLSRVWRVAQGGIVCSIHLYLADAQVSPQSTFLIGLHDGDLLAASLWSGSISKRFSCGETFEHVVAFHTLTNHPDFVLVMVASGAVYTWRIAEETVCLHFQLPHMFHCEPQDFQMTSCGGNALLSIDNDSVSLLDLSQCRLCSFKADGPIIKACLDKAGCYVANISYSSNQDVLCGCCLRAGLVLTVTRLSDGERIGSVRLFKHPSSLVLSNQQRVFVGFEDGSVGVYSVTDALQNNEEFVGFEEFLKGLKQCPYDRAPSLYFPQTKANVTWP